LIYVQQIFFVIHLKNRHDIEFEYRKHDPLLVLKLDRATFGQDKPPGFTGETVALP